MARVAEVAALPASLITVSVCNGSTLSMGSLYQLHCNLVAVTCLVFICLPIRTFVPSVVIVVGPTVWLGIAKKERLWSGLNILESLSSHNGSLNDRLSLTFSPSLSLLSLPPLQPPWWPMSPPPLLWLAAWTWTSSSESPPIVLTDCLPACLHTGLPAC